MLGLKLNHFNKRGLLSRALGERCLVIRADKSFLNFPQVSQHLVAMALPQPPTRAQHVSHVAESGLHIKHGAL